MQEGRVKVMLAESLREVRIICDLILHSRGERPADDNLIAIEMKRSTRPEHEKDEDRLRLRTLTRSSYDGIWSADGVTLPEYVCGTRWALCRARHQCAQLSRRGIYRGRTGQQLPSRILSRRSFTPARSTFGPNAFLSADTGIGPMSIARTAPGKFELQDLVCIELVLRFGREAIERFVVEPKGGEDGSLFTTGAEPHHYEIQARERRDK